MIAGRPLSLRARVMAAAAGFLVLALTSVFVLLGLAIEESLERTFRTHLAFEVDALISAVEPDADGLIGLAYEPVNPLFSVPYSGWYWQVNAGQRVVRSRSLWDRDLPAGTHKGLRGQIHTSVVDGPNGNELQLVERDVVVPGIADPVHVTIAADRADLIEERDRLWLWLGLSLCSLGAFLAMAAFVQVAFVMRPLRRLEANLEDLKTTPDARLPDTQPAELMPMVRAMNRLLDHDATLIANARAHVGNLAHGLKTPLAVLKALSETPGGLDVEAVRTQTEIMGRLIERQLSQARALAGSARVRTLQVDVLPIVRRLISALKTLHQKSIEVEVSGDESVRFTGDQDDLMEILGNVMDNAFTWATRSVTVTVRQVPDLEGFEIVIEDDGPGLDEAHLQAAMKRGYRLDEAVKGTGLGLDIVRDIVSLYGGTLSLERSDAFGGLKVTIAFFD